MELRHLRYAVAVADDLNFSRAAERLHIAQPALSKQIHELEDEIGFRLFERTKRKVEPTEAGRLFLAEARRTLAQAETTLKTAAMLGRGEIGRFSVAVEGSSAYEPIPAILHAHKTRFPKVELVVSELPSAAQVEALRTFQLDVGFLVFPIESDDDLECFTVVKEPVVVALSANHRLSRNEAVALKDLEAERYVMAPESLGCGFHTFIRDMCLDAGFTPNIVQETGHLQTMLGLVAAGTGIAFVPRSSRVHQFPGIVYLPIEPPQPDMTLAAVYRRSNESPLVKSFLRTVRETIGKR